MSAQVIEVITGKKVEPRRMILAGVHGVGKSTFASSAPNPIFIETKDDGLNDIGPARLPTVHSWDEVVSSLAWVHDHDHAYQTLVVDHASGLEELIHSQVAQDKGVEDIESVSKYKAGYEFALKYWDQFLEGP